VFNENAESYDLGSWRGSEGFIADVINKLQLVPGKFFDYMVFVWAAFSGVKEPTLHPVYEFIFKKLKVKHFDWEYLFPRMG
jgi:hypothetical protein